LLPRGRSSATGVDWYFEQPENLSSREEAQVPPATIAPPVIKTLADLQKRLGDIPLERIWYRPAPGTATEKARITRNYKILAPGLDGRFGTRDDKVFAITASAYNSATNAVSLTPKRRLDLHRRYLLIINGSSPTGITDVTGKLVDGNGDGKPGDNYVAILRGFGLDKAGDRFNSLIRDQVNGQPLSSHAVITTHSRSDLVARSLSKETRHSNRASAIHHHQQAISSPKPSHFRPALLRKNR
jgi:hypothetical protein